MSWTGGSVRWTRQVRRTAASSSTSWNTSDYPTRVHHPVEDLVYGRLRTRDPAAAQALDGIEWEHGELEKRTRRFATAVDRALRGEELSPRWLAQMGRDLVERLRGHMAAEETRLFPAARGGLTPGDWADVAL